MNPKFLTEMLAVALLTFCSVGASDSQFEKQEYTIQLKTGKLLISPSTTNEALNRLAATKADGIHVLLLTKRNLKVEERKSMHSKGIIILQSLGNNRYYAKVLKSFKPQDQLHKDIVVNMTLLLRDHKVTPDIAIKERTERKYMVKPGEGPAYNYVVNSDGSLNVTVQFYRGVGENTIRELLRQRVRTFSKLSESLWEAKASRDSLMRLADEDVVQWIDAAPVPFLPENDRTRRIIDVDTVQRFNTSTGQSQGLGGQGVAIGIFDGGVDQGHNDFAGRSLVNNAGSNFHATHVAGIALGSGQMSNQNDSRGINNGGSAYQWRGIAPQANLIDAPSSDSRLAATYLSYITSNGMDLSNHSYSLSFDGAYDLGNQFIDEAINGSAVSGSTPIPRRLYVFSAGNHGSSPTNGGEQIGYFSLTKQVKNGLVVGNYDEINNRISITSSLGPTYDGRIKPDVVAPGESIKSTFYTAPTGTTAAHTNFYDTISGTSMASPAVTGTLALVLQQWANTFDANLDTDPPWPSTLRAIIVHTARDISGPLWFNNEDGPVQAFPGPDFATGWGIIDAFAATGAVTHQRIVQDTIANTCDKKEYTFYLATGNPLKVTLAWDDAPGPVNAGLSTAPLLINDLDLELLDPNGTVHYPWLLNQGTPLLIQPQLCGSAVTLHTDLQPTLNPSYVGPHNAANVNDPIQSGDLRPAVYGRDHLNNLEMVQAEPTPGRWKAVVTGFNIANGPQTFSLILPRSRWIVPHDICLRYPKLCDVVALKDYCRKYPHLCMDQLVLPGLHGPIIEFREKVDQIVLQLNKICQYVLDCPGCAQAALCTGFDIRFPDMADGFKIQVYSSDGKKLYRDMSSAKTKAFRFKVEEGLDYFMILSPGKNTKIGKQYSLRMVVREY